MDTLLQKLAGIYRKPWPLLLVSLLITLGLGWGITKLKIDTDVKEMLPKSERTRVLTELYDSESNFGSSNIALIGIESADIFNRETLSYIQGIEGKITELNKSLPISGMANLLGISIEESTRVLDDLHSVGINSQNYQTELVTLLRSAEASHKKFGWDQALSEKIAARAATVAPEKLFAIYDQPLGRIQSLVSADFIAFEDDALVAKKLIDNGELTPEAIAGLKDRVTSWDTYEGTLVSKDLSLTALTVTLKTQDKDVSAAINHQLLSITANPPAGIKVLVAGAPVVTDHLGAALAKDMAFLIPLMAFVLLLILFFCFRSVQGIVFPLLITIIAIIWTFGLMGHLGVPLSIIGSSIPILLMAIVSAYGIHQMNHYYEDHRLEKFAVLQHNAKSVGLAIFLSGVTVMIGFGSMITLEFLPIRDFGLFTAFGDMVGVLAALFLLPALLMLGKPHKKARPIVAEEDKRDLISKFLRGAKNFGKAHPGRVLVVVGLVALVLIGGATLVKSDMDMVKFFAPDDSIRVSDRILNQKMAGTKTLAIVLDSDIRDPLTRQGNPETLVDLATPEVLKKVDQFSQAVRAQFPSVQKVTSYADVLKKMNQVMNGNANGTYAIPDDPALISQYLVIFSGDTQAVMTGNHDKMRIMVIMNQGSLNEIHRISVWAQEYFDQAFRDKNHLQVQIVGDQQITYMSNQILLKGNLESIIACIIIVFILLLIVLRNLRMSLIAVVPIVLCLVVDFGYLGFTGTELNTTTSLVSAIGIGIGIDFSIHFITWYRRELLVDRNILAAVDRTILHKGRAILYNLLVIVGGFLVLVGSQMGPMKDFGLLTAICLTVTAFGALFVVPAIIRLLAKKDYQFLYLGVTKADPKSLENE